MILSARAGRGAIQTITTMIAEAMRLLHKGIWHFFISVVRHCAILLTRVNAVGPRLTEISAWTALLSALTSIEI
jgi:hypothetical protein